MTNQDNTNRELWLNQASQLLIANVLSQAILEAGHAIPEIKYQVSMGSLTKQNSTLGVCWSRSASTDDTNQIFITPFESDSALILATLTHELIHAYDDCKSGHKGFFAHVARKAGLIGKLTATTANDELQEYFAEIVELLGDIPHAKLDVNKRPNIQKGRSLKMVCACCDFKFNTSQTQIDRITNLACMVCGSPMAQA